MIQEDLGFEQIRTWLINRSGIFYSDQKKELLLQRLIRVQKQFGIKQMSEMANILTSERDRNLQVAVMDAATTNHTFFFRESEVLEKFKTLILPSVSDKMTIRLWSAACSTGDELFTLGMLISETLGPQALLRFQMLGTDLSSSCVSRAEQGMFNERNLEQVPAEYLRKYFVRQPNGQFKITDSILNQCTFRRLNLKTKPYPFRHEMQIIFLRNILYYFNEADQKQTLDDLYNVTEPGGWLVTSVTENIRDLNTRWEPVATGVYRKPGGMK